MNFKPSKLGHLLALPFFILASLPQAHAYYSTLDTGEILERDSYKMGLESQFVADQNEGLNINGRFDAGISQESNFRAVFGGGTTDFHVGGFVKWMPYPDIEGQPAIGLLGGVIYAQERSLSEVSLRVHPLISKKFEIEIGDITPYASVPFGVRSLDGDTTVPVQGVLGAELKTLSLDKVKFLGEVGFNISDAFSYISLAISLNFDEANGIVWQ